MKEVILMGKGELAVKIGGWLKDSPEHQLIEVIPVVPEPDWTDSLIDWAEKNNVSYVDSGNYKDSKAYEKKEEIDLGFSVQYDKILDKEFIDNFQQVLNLHFSPLPKYRGVRPVNWALKKEEDNHGVTIHEITPEIDNGPIVSQATFSIYPDFEEVRDVYNRCIEYGWMLFKDTMPKLDNIEPRPQDDEEATYFSADENHLLGERAHFTKELSRQEMES